MLLRRLDPLIAGPDNLIDLTFAIVSVPAAKAATACAPPIRYTSVIPNSQQTARITGWMLPLCLGGETTAISFTPATWAGTAVIITVEGSGAEAPGTQTPIRLMGVYRMPRGT
jgi:hypothetical protein